MLNVLNTKKVSPDLFIMLHEASSGSSVLCIIHVPMRRRGGGQRGDGRRWKGDEGEGRKWGGDKGESDGKVDRQTVRGGGGRNVRGGADGRDKDMRG